MSTMKKYKPKHVHTDPKNPEAVGQCDRTGFVFNHKDLVKQMAWSGNNLVWTGLLVGRPYVDDPNPQDRPPPLRPDPVPIKNPRIPDEYTTEIRQSLPSDQLMAKLRNFNWNNQ